MDNIITKYHSFWVCLVLTLATTAVFYQVCTYDFVNYDDPFLVYENPNIQAGITLKAVKWAFYNDFWPMWHPLTWFSHMLDWRLFGSNAGGHHLTSLVFHIANTLLLFIVLKQMTHRIWPSAFVAALFALHPLHVESVVWIAERKDVLSTFFWMLTMWAYLRYVKHPGVARYLLMLLTFALGLMGKPMLVTLPFVLLLLDYWPLARVSSERAVGKTDRRSEKYTNRQILYHLIQEKIPLFALSAVSSVVTFLVQRSGGAVAKLVGLTLKIRIFNALISYMEYIWKMIWPVRLAVFYPHPDQNVSILYAIISAVLLLAATILILRFAKNRRYLLTGWFWYLGTLVPVIGLVQVGQQAIADRYTYISLTGLFIIVAWGLPDLLAGWRYKKIALTLSALLIILAMSVCTYFQLRYWQNSLTLFQHALDITGDNYVTRLHLAESFCEQNRLDEAIEMFQKCLQEIPDNPDGLNNLGSVLGKQGKFDEAIKYFTEALRIKPDFADAHNNLGIALAAKGKFTEAVRHYRIALETMDIIPLHRDLGYALLKLGRFEEAVAEYRKVFSAMPNDPDVLNKFGYALAHTGKFDEAISVLTKALRIRPDAATHTNAGYVLALQGNLDEAAVHLTEALRLDPNSEEAHNYLGQTLVQRGKISEAITHFEDALRLKPDWIEPMNNLAWLLATSKETTIHNPDKAVRFAQRACELTNYKKPDLLDTLAVAYAAAGDFSKAIETAEKALELCQSPEQNTLKREIENRLVLYKAGKPYIETQ